VGQKIISHVTDKQLFLTHNIWEIGQSLDYFEATILVLSSVKTPLKSKAFSLSKYPIYMYVYIIIIGGKINKYVDNVIF
jgi:hypothetical protein